jgi:hypothetical protein
MVRVNDDALKNLDMMVDADLPRVAQKVPLFSLMKH